jgi:hypothetical protein
MADAVRPRDDHRPLSVPINDRLEMGQGKFGNLLGPSQHGQAERRTLRSRPGRDTARAMSQENVEIVRELFERFDELEFGQLRGALETSSSLPEAAAKVGDLGRWLLDRLHSGVELDASALPALPDEGNRAQGHQGWFEFWRTWLIPWEEFEYTPKRWHDAGNRVAVELVQRGRLAGGLEYATPISNVWTFGGERVICLQMFGTWAEALDAAARPEQDAHADS